MKSKEPAGPLLMHKGTKSWRRMQTPQNGFNSCYKEKRDGIRKHINPHRGRGDTLSGEEEITR